MIFLNKSTFTVSLWCVLSGREFDGLITYSKCKVVTWCSIVWSGVKVRMGQRKRILRFSTFAAAAKIPTEAHKDYSYTTGDYVQPL